VEFVVEQVQSLGTFSETNWNHRSIVEIPLAKKSDGWFLHAMTGHEAYAKFVFRVPGRPFKEEQLAAKLGLRPLSDTPGLEGYSRDSNRVQVVNGPGVQHAEVVVHRKEEIDTAAFRDFLARAVDVVKGREATAIGGVEGNMPWKKDGEKWHLGEKGFPPGKGAKWDRALLTRLIEIVRQVNPDLEFKWDVRDAITVRQNGASRFWSRIKTKEAEALEVWLICKPGQVNLSRVEGLARHAAVEGNRNDGTDVLKLWFVKEEDLQPAKLKAFLAEHLKGSR
jgi:excinuclease ABC subunit A